MDDIPETTFISYLRPVGSYSKQQFAFTKVLIIFIGAKPFDFIIGMDKIDYNAIKRALERMTCRVHGEHPTITIVSNGINIQCCCEQFQNELTKKTEYLATKQVSDAIDAAFRKAFK